MRKLIWCGSLLAGMTAAAVLLMADHVARHPDGALACCARAACSVATMFDPQVGHAAYRVATTLMQEPAHAHAAKAGQTDACAAAAATAPPMPLVEVIDLSVQAIPEMTGQEEASAPDPAQDDAYDRLEAGRRLNGLGEIGQGDAVTVPPTAIEDEAAAEENPVESTMPPAQDDEPKLMDAPALGYETPDEDQHAVLPPLYHVYHDIFAGSLITQAKGIDEEQSATPTTEDLIQEDVDHAKKMVAGLWTDFFQFDKELASPEDAPEELPYPANEAADEDEPLPVGAGHDSVHTGSLMFGVGVNSDAGLSSLVGVNSDPSDLPAPLTVTINNTIRLQMKGKQAIETVRSMKEGIVRITPVPDDPTTIQVTGLQPGTTPLALTALPEQSEVKPVTDSYEVVVTLDTDLLEKMIKKAAPTSSIRVVPVGKTMVLAGTVEVADDIGLILNIARSGGPGWPQFVNAMRVQSTASQEASGEESQEMRPGTPPDCREDANHDQQYPGCPYMGGCPGNMHCTPTTDPETPPKTKKKKKAVARPEDVEGAAIRRMKYEEFAEPSARPVSAEPSGLPTAPRIDTMEFRRSDAKPGEFDPRPF